MKIGEVIPKNRTLVLNAGRPTVSVMVANLGDRPIQVGSHFHFYEVNPQLRFVRAQAYGFRLDIPSGTSVRFEPGEERSVQLVALGGRRFGYGLNGFCMGGLDNPEVAQNAQIKMQAKVGSDNEL